MLCWLSRNKKIVTFVRIGGGEGGRGGGGSIFPGVIDARILAVLTGCNLLKMLFWGGTVSHKFRHLWSGFAGSALSRVAIHRLSRHRVCVTKYSMCSYSLWGDWGSVGMALRLSDEAGFSRGKRRFIPGVRGVIIDKMTRASRDTDVLDENTEVRLKHLWRIRSLVEIWCCGR